MVPPSFLTTAISRRSTFVAFGSRMDSMASTASGARSEALFEMTLELSDVDAALMSWSRSLRSTGTDISLRISSDFLAASKKDSEITVG